ncbi:MAG: DUF805 domain-containing protein [Ancalomicrobiaceae bacterium]|nr:DUF805 domain-containing protein [Ancalomicrobiaceae bacterium]
MANWFVSVNGEQKGPYPTEQLRQLVADGFISRDAYVWRDGMAQWQLLSQVRLSDDPAGAPVEPARPAAASYNTPQPSYQGGQGGYQQPSGFQQPGGYQQSPYQQSAPQAYGQQGYANPVSDARNRGYFSFQGRIGRKTFWLSYVLLQTIVIVVLGIIGTVLAQTMMSINDEGMPVFAPPFYVFLAVCGVIYIFLLIGGLAGAVKRLHDRDRTGWFIFIQLIPIVGPIWFIVEVGFLRGTPGANRYGVDPLAV